MYKYNQSPELPSLEAMQAQVRRAAENPLKAGYVCYTGYTLTAIDAEAINGYITTALEYGVFNDQERLNGVLDRKHRSFVMIAEQHEYMIGFGFVPKIEAEQIRASQSNL